MRTNKSQFAEYECSPTASSFVFIAGRRAATEVELSSSGRREGVRRLAAPTDTLHSSPVDLGESHLQGVALMTRAWGISTELLCIVCFHLSGATSRRIYSNAILLLAAAAEQCGSFFVWPSHKIYRPSSSRRTRVSRQTGHSEAGGFCFGQYLDTVEL